MGNAVIAFQFLALPPELRVQIYEELLCPRTVRVLTLYHDRRGRGRDFNIHTVILRITKQIYYEASWVFYSYNTFEIMLTSDVMYKLCKWNYSDTRVDPRPLFRQEKINLDLRHVPWQGGPVPLLRGIIYPHCFQRLRHLRVVTTQSSVWGWSMREGHYFSRTGELILEILQSLVGEDPGPRQTEKKLEFKVQPAERKKYDSFLTHLTDALDWRIIDRRAGEISVLINNVEATRTVSFQGNFAHDVETLMKEISNGWSP